MLVRFHMPLEECERVEKDAGHYSGAGGLDGSDDAMEVGLLRRICPRRGLGLTNTVSPG